MAQLERRVIPIEELEIRSKEGGPTVIRGYAAVFEKLSVPMWGFREKIRAGAFTKSLSENENIKALWNHNSDYPLGSTKNGTLKLEENSKGLKFELNPPETGWGRDAMESIKRGDTDGVSFGFRVKVDEWDETDPNNTVRTLVEVDLVEVSPTPFPAYPQTSVGVRSAQEIYESHLAERDQEGPGAGKRGNDDNQAQEQMGVYEAEIKLLQEM